jgi:hypothetical protein
MSANGDEDWRRACDAAYRLAIGGVAGPCLKEMRIVDTLDGMSCYRLLFAEGGVALFNIPDLWWVLRTKAMFLRGYCDESHLVEYGPYWSPQWREHVES